MGKIKTSTILLRSCIALLLVVVLVLSCSVLMPIKQALASEVTQGYKSTESLQKGAVVSLTKTGAQDVEKTTTENDGLLAGVVVDAEDSVLDVLPAGSKVRVATSGEVNLLVSTVNGDIKAGDKLIASPLAGIAAEDYPPAPGVKYIAVAESGFTQNTSGAQKISVKLNDGSSKDTYVGVIKAKMLLGNRSSANASGKNLLEKIAHQVSGKSDSYVQVLAAVMVFITTVTLAGIVLYGSVRGTFVSLGRNPLSRDSVLTGLVRVILVSVLVLCIGVVSAYAILVL